MDGGIFCGNQSILENSKRSVFDENFNSGVSLEKLSDLGGGRRCGCDYGSAEASDDGEIFHFDVGCGVWIGLVLERRDVLVVKWILTSYLIYTVRNRAISASERYLDLYLS
jgi:hypothetical protein